jgi:hypothetical protein
VKTAEIIQGRIACHLLEGAEWHLREFGWIQGWNENESGMCLLTALNKSIRDIYGRYDFENDPEPEPVIQVWDAIMNEIPGNSPLVAWNDQEDTNFTDIISVISRAKDSIAS